MMDHEPVLVILMRSDMDSLNPGKAMAQASHATSLFEKTNYQTVLHEEWKNHDGFDLGFGVTLVLDVKNGENLMSIIEEVETITSSTGSYVDCGVVIDPTYPIRDGDVVHHISITTCGYLFGRKNLLDPYIKDLVLYK